MKNKLFESIKKHNPIKSIFSRKLLEGKNTWFDRTIFRFFEGLDETGKNITSDNFKNQFSKRMMNYLLEVVPGYESALPLLGSKEEEVSLVKYKKRRFLEVAQPCDVILVRGNLRISRIIQTLTKSPYSHAAFYQGEGKIIESDPAGVLLEDIDKYISLDIRICRPVMLSKKGQKIVLEQMKKMLELQPKYDIKNIEKLLFKYWYTKFRPDAKVYIGGNTKFERLYICSGMIAHAFHKAGYPITPSLRLKPQRKKRRFLLSSIDEFETMAKFYKKNYSQIVPGDFDNSSFFASVKFLYLDSKYIGNKRIQLEQEDEDEI